MKKLNKKHKIMILVSIIILLILIAVIIGTNIIRNQITSEEYNVANGSSSNGNLLPEYIKAGITLGGVTGTLEDLDTFDATAEPDDILEGKTAYVKGQKITGTRKKEKTLASLKVGDYVDYNPDSANYYTQLSYATTGNMNNNSMVSQEDLNWRVLSINNEGTVDLISETATSQVIYFNGAVGYNNGVFLLNDLAESLYSNDSLNATARSINVGDVEKHMSSSGLSYAHSYISSNGTRY